MIDMTVAATAAVASGYVLRCRASAWLGDELLADDVPVAGGQEEVDRSLRIPERVTLEVPRLEQGVTWDPAGDTTAPLAPFGQTLRIDLGVDLGRQGVEWLRRGEFLISTTELQGDTVAVEAVGLLTLIEEARFVSPFQPSGTFASTVKALVEPALTVEIDSALTDRNVPASLQWDEERLDGLWELLDAWPADAHVRPDGVLYVSDPPTLLPESQYDLTDGVGGTVIQWSSGATRDGAATVVVARGQTADGTQVQGVAYDTAAASPLRYGGPFNPLPVPFFFFSPLLVTNAQCTKAANTILARLRRSAAHMLTASIVPNPALQAGDAVAATGAGLTAADTVMEAYRLPYNAERGDAEARLRIEV